VETPAKDAAHFDEVVGIVSNLDPDPTDLDGHTTADFGPADSLINSFRAVLKIPQPLSNWITARQLHGSTHTRPFIRIRAIDVTGTTANTTSSEV
jgi:hypothetical protein